MKVFVAILLITTATAMYATPPVNPEAKMHTRSTVIEKERPELDEETRRLISEFRRNPTEANRQALRRKVEASYDAVVAKKQAKLEELRRTARDQSQIDEMQVIVDEMLRDRENRVNQTMNRFADPRLRPDARQTTDGFLPVIGAAQNLSIATTPVTNEQYAQFLKATGHPAPAGWQNGSYPTGKGNHPVVKVTWEDAVEYCKWLSTKDPAAKYRLPTEAEWEIAAGHMPKDADFNNGEHSETTPVDSYPQTPAACGALDMWGNVWEWTSTPITVQDTPEQSHTEMAIKGGAFDSPRTECRTENRGVGRPPQRTAANLGFRVVREK